MENSKKHLRTAGVLCLFISATLALQATSAVPLFAHTINMKVNSEIGIASFYGIDPQKEHLNVKTASGQVFYPSLLTAASYKYFKKYLRVKSLVTGKEITVYCNDKGPAKRLGRLLDLTPAAFQLLGHSLKDGLAKVEVTVYE